MERKRFTGKEDVALKQIVNERGTRRVNWADVVTKLHELGYAKRTAKSVRNRHLRQKKVEASMFYSPGRNRCRKCGKFQRGHVCLLEDPEPPPAPLEEAPEAALEEGRGEAEECSS